MEITQNELLAEIAVWVRDNPRQLDPQRQITYRMYQDYFHCSIDRAKRDLQRMVAQGRLRRVKVSLPRGGWCVAFEKVLDKTPETEYDKN